MVMLKLQNFIPADHGLLLLAGRGTCHFIRGTGNKVAHELASFTFFDSNAYFKGTNFLKTSDAYFPFKNKKNEPMITTLY